MYSIISIYFGRFLKIFFQILLVVVPVSLLWFFMRPGIEISGISISNPLYSRFDLLVILILFFVAFSLMSFMVFLAFSIYLTYRRERVNKKIQSLNRIFVIMIVNYLFSDRYREGAERKAFCRRIKKLAPGKLRTEAFFTAITGIQETITIDCSADFRNLISEIGLDRRIYRFLYSFNLSDRIIAMRVVSYLRITHEGFLKRIEYYSSKKNFALRTEAYAALIRLMEKDYHLVSFIGNRHKLSMLDINVIVNAALKNKKVEIDYQALLSSPLVRKVVVGLMLAKYRYRKDSKSLVLILNQVGSPDPLLNMLAWDALLNLVPKHEGIDIIIDRFDKESEEIKLMILKNYHGVRDKRFFDFLREVIIKEPLFVKIEAMNILFRENFDYLREFMKTGNPEIEMAFKEVTDLHIN